MPELSLRARTVGHALTSAPPFPPVVGIGLLSTLLDGDQPAATSAFDELVGSSFLVRDEDAPGHFRISKSAAAAFEGEEPSAATRELSVRFLVLMAVLANDARDRFATRIIPVDVHGAVPFATPGEAMLWFEHNRTALIELVENLFARREYRRCFILAEAVFGLAGHSGHQQNQLFLAQTMLESLSKEHFGIGRLENRGDADERDRLYNLATARVNLMLASVLSNRHGRRDALKAIDERGIYFGRRRYANVLTALGRFDEAQDQFDGAAEAASNLGHAIAYARVLTETGPCLTAAGKPAEAMAVLSTAQSTLDLEDAGCDAYLADIDRNKAFALHALNRPEGANICFQRAVERYEMGGRVRTADELKARWAESE